MLAAALLPALVLAAPVSAQEMAPWLAAGPTHYLFTPTPYVNPPSSLVIGLHEISYTLPYNLQIQASPFDNIGRINFGLKYGLYDSLSAGIGLAHTLIHPGPGAHGIPSEESPRVGTFLAWGPWLSERLETVLVLHAQAGDRISAGVDGGILAKTNEAWDLMLETGFSYDFEYELFHVYLSGGARIIPPRLDFLAIDFGVSLEEFPVGEGDSGVAGAAYFDLLFFFDFGAP